jgi:hypothetical protein
MNTGFFNCFKTIFEVTRILVDIQVLAAVVMNVAIFWDIAPCSPYVSRNVASHTDYMVLYPRRRQHTTVLNLIHLYFMQSCCQ